MVMPLFFKKTQNQHISAIAGPKWIICATVAGSKWIRCAVIAGPKWITCAAVAVTK